MRKTCMVHRNSFCTCLWLGSRFWISKQNIDQIWSWSVAVAIQSIQRTARQDNTTQWKWMNCHMVFITWFCCTPCIQCISRSPFHPLVGDIVGQLQEVVQRIGFKIYLILAVLKGDSYGCLAALGHYPGTNLGCSTASTGAIQTNNVPYNRCPRFLQLTKCEKTRSAFFLSWVTFLLPGPKLLLGRTGTPICFLGSRTTNVRPYRPVDWLAICNFNRHTPLLWRSLRDVFSCHSLKERQCEVGVGFAIMFLLYIIHSIILM